MHLLAAVTHTPGIVIGQDQVAKSGKANEISHFKPLLGPLPLARAVITTDAMQANRDNSLFVRKVKDAHWLWPILGNQPNLNETLNALPWDGTPVAAATSEITRGRIETRTIRVLPAPKGNGFAGAARALLIERYTTYKNKGRWRTRAEAVLYLTSLAAQDATPGPARPPRHGSCLNSRRYCRCGRLNPYRLGKRLSCVLQARCAR